MFACVTLPVFKRADNETQQNEKEENVSPVVFGLWNVDDFSPNCLGLNTWLPVITEYEYVIAVLVSYKC